MATSSHSDYPILSADISPASQTGAVETSAHASCLREFIGEAASIATSDASIQGEFGQYGANFLKTAAFFMPGEAGLVSTIALSALDQASLDGRHNFGTDLLLGGLKGAAMRAAFRVMGNEPLGDMAAGSAALKGVSFGLVNRSLDVVLNQDSYYDSKGQFAPSNMPSKFVRDVIVSGALISDGITFAAAQGMFSALNKANPNLFRTELAKTVAMSGTFGVSGGAANELLRQRDAHEQFNLNKVLGRSLLQGALDALAGVPGGMKLDTIKSGEPRQDESPQSQEQPREKLVPLSTATALEPPLTSDGAQKPELESTPVYASRSEPLVQQVEAEPAGERSLEHIMRDSSTPPDAEIGSLNVALEGPLPAVNDGSHYEFLGGNSKISRLIQVDSMDDFVPPWYQREPPDLTQAQKDALAPAPPESATTPASTETQSTGSPAPVEVTQQALPLGQPETAQTPPPNPSESTAPPETELPASTGEVQAPTGEVPAPTSEVQAPTGEVPAPTSEVQAPTGEVPVLDRRAQMIALMKIEAPSLKPQPERLTSHCLVNEPVVERNDTKGPFSDFADYTNRALTTVPTDVRSYAVSGHSTEVAIPNRYAEALEGRSSSSDSANSPDLSNRVTPADIPPLLDAMPSSRYFKRIWLSDKPNPEDDWVSQTYSNGFISEMAMTEGQMSMYRSKLTEYLRRDVLHEWSHELRQEFWTDELAWRFADAVNLEMYEWSPNNYSKRNRGEQWAVLGERMLGTDTDGFLEAAEKAPIRTVIWMRALKKCLDNVPAENRSISHDQYVLRQRFVDEFIAPKAIEKLKNIQTNDPIEFLRGQASTLLQYLEGQGLSTSSSNAAEHTQKDTTPAGNGAQSAA